MVSVIDLVSFQHRYADQEKEEQSRELARSLTQLNEELNALKGMKFINIPSYRT